MPHIELAPLHPIVVHFAIALAVVGVLFRWVSLLGRPAFLGPAAATLIVLAAIAGVVASESGEKAHGPVERMPGVRQAVVAHEQWGERAEQALLALAAVELLALALYKWSKVGTVRIVAAVVGVAAVFCVYEAGEHGGTLVYSYAGGVGTRTGNPQDLERLFLASSYHQAMAARRGGQAQQAAGLLADAAKRWPSETSLQLMAAESLNVDGKDPRAALEAVAAVAVPADNRALRMQKASIIADAHLAAGEPNQAVAALEEVARTFPNPRLQQRIDALKSAAPKP